VRDRAVTEPVLDAPRVVARAGQRVAAGVVQDVGVNRKGEAGARADALDEPIDGVGRERAAALGGEDEGAVSELPAQLARSHLVAAHRSTVANYGSRRRRRSLRARGRRQRPALHQRLPGRGRRFHRRRAERARSSRSIRSASRISRRWRHNATPPDCELVLLGDPARWFGGVGNLLVEELRRHDPRLRETLAAAG
jgi:hypothetical protein